jgi:hypothetical protein
MSNTDAQRVTAEDIARFHAKVDKTDGCWPWDGTVHSSGYGRFWFHGRTIAAHRFAYEINFGRIPDELRIDHRCHNEDLECSGGSGCLHRRCVNPAHLEAVTPRENTLRGRGIAAIEAKRTHCPQGHPYSAENTHIQRNGSRVCRTCKRAQCARWRAQRRLSKAGQTQ